MSFQPTLPFINEKNQYDNTLFKRQALLRRCKKNTEALCSFSKAQIQSVSEVEKDVASQTAANIFQKVYYHKLIPVSSQSNLREQ